MTPIELRVTQEQLFALGSKLKPLGELSPLLPRSDEQEKIAGSRIISPTLIGGGGEIQPEYLPTLQIMADPAAYVYLTYVGRAINLECTSYFSDPSGSSEEVSLAADEDSLVVNHPGIMKQMREILGQYIGETLIRSLDYEISLSLAEAWVFFAVLDASRIQILNTHLQYDTPASLQLTQKEVKQSVRSDSNSLQWLSPYFAQCLSLATLSSGDIQVALEKLKEGGLLEIDGDRILPGRILQGLAIEYLVTDGHFRLRSDVLLDNEQLTTDLRAVQGRSGAIMVWSYDQGSIDLFGLSPAEFMLTVQGITENPSMHLDGGPAVKAAPDRTPPPPESL
jgi:hypothetical protein